MGSFGYTAVEENTGYRIKVVYGQGAPGTQGPAGPSGPPGPSVELRLEGEEVQWRIEGEENWLKLMDIVTLTGPMGPDGPQGPPGETGEDGPPIELAVADGAIQWRVQGSTEEDWEPLIEMVSLEGQKGEPGFDGENGTGFVLQGQVATTADLPGQPEIGDAYLIGNDVHLWGYKNGNASPEWIVVGDVSISQSTLDLLARKKELYFRQMRPGDKKSAFSRLNDGDWDNGDDPAGIVTNSPDDGRTLRVEGQHVIATRERVAIESNRVYELRAKARRIADPSDPANDAITVHVSWLDENMAVVSRVQLAMKELNASNDDMLDVEMAISRELYTYGLLGGCAQTQATEVKQAYTPPAGAVYAVPYIRVYGADSVTDIIHLEMRDGSTYGDFSRLALPPDYRLPQEITPGPVVPQTIFVSAEGGDDASNGKSMGCAVKSLERAMEIVETQALPHAVEVLPGKYETSGHIDVPDNCSGVVAATNSRSTKIVPTPGNEEKNVLRMGDGGYVEGFSFEGWQIDDMDNPSEGFAVSFRPGAIIRRSVFAFNITVFRATPATLIPPPVDPENGNPLVPKGPGVGLADKSVVSQYSPFPQLMLWGATPVCPNGIGYVAKNGAFLNGINAVALWMHKHYMALSGGEIVLTNCASQFGDYSIWSEGYTYRIEPEFTTASMVVDESVADTIANNKQAIINGMWNYLQNNGYGGVNEEFTKRDAGFYLTALEYDLRAGQQESMRRFAKGMFDYAGDFVATSASISGFEAGWDWMRDDVKARVGASGPLATMIDELNRIVKDTVNNPEKILKPSKVTSVGHQWNNNFAGVNARALDRPTREVYDSIVERDFGTVTYSGVDDSGKQFFTGGALVNPLTGQFEGPPVDRTINPRAMRAAIIAGGMY